MKISLHDKQSRSMTMKPASILFFSGLLVGSLLTYQVSVGRSLSLCASQMDVFEKGAVIDAKGFHTPMCTQDQLDLHVKLFDPWKKPFYVSDKVRRRNKPLKKATGCPDDSSYVGEYFGKMKSDSFMAVNVGCNKGLDAVAIAALLSQDRKFSLDSWRELLDPKTEPVCGMPKLNFYDGVPSRKGRVFCVEPMPSTVSFLQKALEANSNYKDSLVVSHAAISNTSGTVLFPSDEAGSEARSIGECYQDPRPDDVQCIEVPLKTVDSYLKEQMVDLSENGDMIDLLLIDAEGFDWEVIRGSPETLKRTKFITFEVNGNGVWHQHSLVDTVNNELRDFNCYWLGRGKLWRMTNCMDDEMLKTIYEHKVWSNVGCVRRTEIELAKHMETIFLETQASKTLT